MSGSGDDSDDSDHFRDDDLDHDLEEGRKAANIGVDDDDGGGGGGGLDLTGFLFGNIDVDGRLSEESAPFLDRTSKNKLGGLARLLGGAGVGADSLVRDEGEQDEEEEDSKSVEFDGTKDPQARDFSTIDEAMSDDSSSMSSSRSDEETEVDSVKEEPKALEDIIKQEKTEENETLDQSSKSQSATIPKTKEEPLEDDVKSPPSDEKLMPPPSTVPPRSNPSKLRKPLAAMLPEKYKEVDVRELFPEFRQNSVLRFSRLFPIKPSHRPRFWKNVKKKKPDSEEQTNEVKLDLDWKLDIPDLPDDPAAFLPDDMERFMQPKETKVDEKEEEKEEERRGPKPTDWRWGPAQYWYDMLGLPESVDSYDYGLKTALEHMDDEVGWKNEKPESGNVKKEIPKGEEEDKSSKLTEKIEFPPDAFLMVTQANWEEEVVWNGDDIRHKVLQKLSSKTNAAGWVPSSFNRTAGCAFSAGGAAGGQTPGSIPGSSGSVKAMPGIKLQTLQHRRPENGDDTFYSIFPVENEELAYGRWEDEVIWDTESMPTSLRPKMVSLDPNDDNIILGIPDDIDPSTLPSDQPVRKVKVIQKHVKKSRMLLNRSGIISVVEEESPPPPPKNDNKDPFNISNDEYYVPKAQESLIKVATGGTLLQHATPVVELRAPFVPTHIGPMKLRQFHRWPLKRFSHGPLSNYTQAHGVNPLLKHMKKKAKAREMEREAAGGGEIFFMRTPEDVSGRDGELVLFEFSEEHPPLLSLIGMASKVKNYYKRKPGSDTKSNPFRYGELNVAHTSPFLGQMAPGQLIQTLENNLFRSPIYEHKPPTSDFVVIRTRYDYSIREIDGLFVSGQECPLYEVPGPNSKRSNNFTRDFLQVFIYRLFWRSRDNPRRIKMDEIKKAFPAHSESSIRKRLKPCAEFHRTGHDSNWWVIKPNFRLPTEEEMRAMVTPEQCCAYFSMIAAEQRLRDAGYGEKFLLAQQDDDDEETAMKMDDEVKVAPWNTTRAYILAMKGKCLLQLTGPADPTGPAGEGFSYVRIPNKPTNKEDQEQQPKRTVTGTDADLRKLPLKDARAILRKNGVPEEEIKKLSRWEVIDVVRTLSTEKVKAGEDGDHKFSRGNRFSIAEHQERYREDCQRIFEVQNKVLASDEVLSSDEAESSEDEDVNDEDLDEMGKNIENMLSNKKTSMQFQREREEAERRKLQKMIMGDTAEGPEQSQQSQQHGATKRKKEDGGDEEEGANTANKVLIITRTFRNPSGKEYTRVEKVRKPLVIETYVKVRETKDEAFIRQFATLDDTAKEEMKKEKRRLQEQLRRIKRNQQLIKEKELKAAAAAAAAAEAEADAASSAASKRRAAKSKPDLKLKCGACGAKGHMRTNKACPKFVASEFDGPLNVALTEKEEEEMEKKLEDEEELINVEGTKMTLSAKLLQHADEVRKKTMVVKVPKKILQKTAGMSPAAAAAAAAAKRRRAGTVEHCDYLSNKNYRPVKRRRTDPVVSLASFLEGLHGELRVMDEALQFLQPVNTKKVPDYLEKVKTPMDLQTVRENIQKKKYRSREDFLSDINQIVQNSVVYNGENDVYTMNAKELLRVVINKFSENEDTLMRIEKAINPLLDDNSQVSWSYVIKTILEEKVAILQEYRIFEKPVDRKKVKGYYDVIKQPMDLETIGKKLDKHAYHSRQEFLADVELIYSNSMEFNGESSDITHKARSLLEFVRSAMAPYDEELNKYEEKIREVQQRALEQAEMDSLGTSLGEEGASSQGLEQQPIKRKRGRPRKKKLPETPEEEDDSISSARGLNAPRAKKTAATVAMAEQAAGNLEDDLQYSSEEDPDDEDWEQVEEEEGLTVTIEPMEGPQESVVIEEGQVVDISDMGYYQDNASDGMMFAAAAAAHQDEQEGVDEDYDPTDFLHSIGKGGGATGGSQSQPEMAPEVQAASSDLMVQGTMAMPDILSQAMSETTTGEEQPVLQVQAATGQPSSRPIDVINEDLDISDDSDEEESFDDKTVVAPPAPPLVPKPPEDDYDDGAIYF